MNKKQRGQFFTQNLTVQTVLTNLLNNSGSLLEPSAGTGELMEAAHKLGRFPEIVGLELDSTLKSATQLPITYGNFFTLADQFLGYFDSILGNPPFVAWRDVEADTLEAAKVVKQRYQDKTNLYHLFIDRCIDLLKPGGELVFIVPKEWLYTTSAGVLREKIVSSGSLTHLIDCGEEKLFVDADVPALLIFRFIKTITNQPTFFAPSLASALREEWEERTLSVSKGRFLLLPAELTDTIKDWTVLGDQYSVKVGMVTGLDGVFRLSEEQSKLIEPEAIRSYITTKGVELYLDLNHIDSHSKIPPNAHEFLQRHKDALMNRRIAKFTESNYWRYGAIRNKESMDSDAPRLYALAKTRRAEPFFKNETVKYYGGGVLGIFKRPEAKVSLDTTLRVLNSPDYRKIMEAMFLTTGNKVSLQPATLEHAPFPSTEREALIWIKNQAKNR